MLADSPLVSPSSPSLAGPLAPTLVEAAVVAVVAGVEAVVEAVGEGNFEVFWVAGAEVVVVVPREVVAASSAAVASTEEVWAVLALTGGEGRPPVSPVLAAC